MTQIKYPALMAIVLSMGILLASGLPHAEDRINDYGQDAKDQNGTDTGRIDQPHKPSGMDTERPMDLDQEMSPTDRTRSDRFSSDKSDDENR